METVALAAALVLLPLEDRVLECAAALVFLLIRPPRKRGRERKKPNGPSVMMPILSGFRQSDDGQTIASPPDFIVVLLRRMMRLLLLQTVQICRSVAFKKDGKGRGGGGKGDDILAVSVVENNVEIGKGPFINTLLPFKNNGAPEEEWEAADE